ncbi:TPA_asm: VLTF [Trichoplax MELD virus]|nr:TPA_asm: VLTF [Trichoplax MELD virus]
MVRNTNSIMLMKYQIVVSKRAKKKEAENLHPKINNDLSNHDSDIPDDSNSNDDIDSSDDDRYVDISSRKDRKKFTLDDFCLKCGEIFDYGCECPRIDVKNTPWTCEKCDTIIEQTGTEYLCIKCGCHYGYIFVPEYNHTYVKKKRSIYHRKYHIMNKLNQLQLKDFQLGEFLRYFEQANISLSEILKGMNRKRYINTMYIFHKLLIILHRADIASQCKLPKSKATLNHYENIWKAVCEVTGWEFLPST